ncbi:GntR family transcriptional regulator [Enterococcus moraviensis ATCC BAA-383]|uniref:GntR family transcriptional regulator n=1 Tax=Enterococcus moraviensis ATCC BAA-383 TaxID=1158609 RepID=R2R5H8_9ENTE|nr:GntR family transcriptional regulator [Enterococcus moraviensis]EOI03051.1 GntR family transcriptional regulator [Enterococcus moraviensis ATCC BAA-383]EOT74072.1 GntR family transcriptional regulator [Enterococcus moraviensis ATCC BAA-383]OJG67236.1 GntR family transcriptional regulator [Enterococcus moraviensis]
MRRKSVLYLDVAEQIKSDIMNGTYPVGSLLPTEAELEQLFDVSKITVRRAIELLSSEELVEKKSGKGTTVLSNRPYNKLSKAGTFTEYLNNSGQKVAKKILKLETVTLVSGSAVYSCLGEKAVKVSRLYILDDQPYIYFNYYLPMTLEDVPLADFEQESLYRLMDQHGIEIMKFEDSFQTVELTAEQQQILTTSEKNGLKRIRKSVDLSGKIVEFSEAIYNTSLYPYVIEYEA